MNTFSQSSDRQKEDQYLVALDPTGAAYLDINDKITIDLCGAVILGSVTALSEEEAHMKAVALLPYAHYIEGASTAKDEFPQPDIYKILLNNPSVLRPRQNKCRSEQRGDFQC